MMSRAASLCQSWQIEDAPSLNASLLAGFQRCREQPQTRQSHHFGGRFENIYISPAQLPELQALYDITLTYASDLLCISPGKLRIGGWFNAMEPGHVTLPHDHEEDDELLSAVYYVQVPAGSGDLVVHHEDESEVIRPKAGMLVCFSPALSHEVGENKSQELRLSIGMNIGPFQDDKESAQDGSVRT